MAKPRRGNLFDTLGDVSSCLQIIVTFYKLGLVTASVRIEATLDSAQRQRTEQVALYMDDVIARVRLPSNQHGVSLAAATLR